MARPGIRPCAQCFGRSADTDRPAALFRARAQQMASQSAGRTGTRSAPCRRNSWSLAVLTDPEGARNPSTGDPDHQNELSSAPDTGAIQVPGSQADAAMIRRRAVRRPRRMPRDHGRGRVCCSANRTCATRPAQPRCRSGATARTRAAPWSRSRDGRSCSNTRTRGTYPRLRTADVRPMHAWEFYDDPGSRPPRSPARRSPRCGSWVRRDRLGVDRLGTPGFLALQLVGLRLVDSAPVTPEAREIKTPKNSRCSARTAGS